MWLHTTCTSEQTKGPQGLAKTQEGKSSLNLTIQAELRNQGVGGGSSSRLFCLELWLWVGMLVILCIEQVREVRGSEQIHHFALLRSTARLSMMLFLVVKIEKPHPQFILYRCFPYSPFQQWSQAHRDRISTWRCHPSQCHFGQVRLHAYLSRSLTECVPLLFRGSRCWM